MDIKELKELWHEFGFRPKKKMGQNFLVDNNIKENIINALPLDEGKTVLEIGPGFGVMTLLLADKCERLFAVEKDPRICAMMEPIFKQKPNIELINDYILEVDIPALKGDEERILVFGNVPYYISSPIIQKMIDHRQSVEALYMVVQEEFADRVVSSPGTKVYGSLSCYCQYYTSAKKIFRIKKGCFMPRPKVDSCLIGLEMLDEPSVKVDDENLMFKIIRAAFSQRRKQIINPLSSTDFNQINKCGWKQIFSSCNIDTSNRAENLSLSDYAKLSDTVGEILAGER